MIILGYLGYFWDIFGIFANYARDSWDKIWVIWVNFGITNVTAPMAKAMSFYGIATNAMPPQGSYFRFKFYVLASQHNQ